MGFVVGHCGRFGFLKEGFLMKYVKWAAVWLLTIYVILAIENKTGIFKKILTAGGRVNTPFLT